MGHFIGLGVALCFFELFPLSTKSHTSGTSLNNEVVEQIAQVLLDAGATAHSINEKPPVKIRNIAPYPGLFRAEMQRLFGIRLIETDLYMTIDELASQINLNHTGNS